MKRRIFVSSFGHIALTGLLKDSGKLLPGSSVGKESSCNSGDPSLIPGSGRSAGEGIGTNSSILGLSLVAQLVKNLPAKQETWVRSLGWKDLLEKGMVTHSTVHR